MSESKCNPRRRSYNQSLLSSLSTSSSSSGHLDNSSSCRRTGFYNMPLRKGATFHSPSTPKSEECDPILSIPALPRRSPTCTRSLEDVIAAGEKRMAQFLGNFERNLFGLASDAASSKPSPRDDELPVPRGILDARIAPTDSHASDTDTKPIKKEHDRSSPAANSPHRHTSDSGLGTSISGSMAGSKQVGAEMRSSATSQSAITRSVSANQPQNTQSNLGPSACKHIEHFILNPILREKRLTPFHPLAKGVPQRIGTREITCLRDLEKTLLLLAPVSEIGIPYIPDYAHAISRILKKYAISKASYIGFCEFTIQCIHTTVGHLNEREQRLPADRPYTNGYFLDLVEQIRHYGNFIRASRERQASGSASKHGVKMEYSSDEELVLEGGLSTTGRPAELVRKKKGQAVSLRTGEAYEEKASPLPTMKRALSMESGDDSVMRSMARRKKNEPPMNINKKCSHCDKVFKRPCDLTKHEKTHIRPYKCPEPACKYHQLGWPTEKECDRHVNDKHSKAPPLFKCKFPPCSYQSKRESNCKQHMEKAHGWVYIRSKNNGKAASSRASAQAATPRTPNIATPISGPVDIPTPISGPAASPYVANEPKFHYGDSDVHNPPNDMMNAQVEDFPLFGEAPNFGDFSPFPPPLDFNTFHQGLQASDPNEYVPALDMRLPSLDSNATTHEALQSAPSETSPFEPPEATPNLDFDWDNMDNDYTAMNMQLLTPETVEAHALKSFSRNPSICMPSPVVAEQKMSNLSPAGQGNIMLYSPNSHGLDEGFYDQHDHHLGKGAGDFTLFDSPMGTGDNQPQQMNASMMGVGMGATNSMFPPLNSESQQQYSLPDWSERIDPMTMDVDDYMRMDEL